MKINILLLFLFSFSAQQAQAACVLYTNKTHAKPQEVYAEKAFFPAFLAATPPHQEQYLSAYTAWLSLLQHRRLGARGLKQAHQKEIARRLLLARTPLSYLRRLNSKERALLDLDHGFSLPLKNQPPEQAAQDARHLRRINTQINRETLHPLHQLQQALDANTLMQNLAVNPEISVLFDRTQYALNIPGFPRASASATKIAQRLFSTEANKDNLLSKKNIFPSKIEVCSTKAVLTFKPLRQASHAPNLVFIFDVVQQMVFIRFQSQER